ncbi:MAG: Rieske 2Fe-2S domain-containing protein [bacterium]|nr:Rieske 2Fe-2S domain-containing protein [bacterium]
MSATAILITSLIAVGVVVAAGVFAVAWRRGPSASPIVGEFDRKAAKRDSSAKTKTEPEPVHAEVAAPAHEPITIEDDRIEISATEMGVTRRKFLNRALLGVFGIGFLGPLGISMVAFMWPKLSGGFGSKINVGPIADLRSKVVPGDGTIHPLFVAEAQSWLVPMDGALVPGSSFEGLPVVAGADGGDTGLMALWQKCVHLGCRVPECGSSQGFECPCHGSKYNFHGEYDSGPAPRNLDRFALEVDAQGNLIVDTGTVLETPRAKIKTIAYPQGPSCL